MDARTQPRIVLAHDWLTGMRGGEKVLEPLCRRWPDATLFTLLHRPGSVSPAIERLPRRTSFLNALPGVHRYYRYLLPLMPAAVAAWNLPRCDLVLSRDSGKRIGLLARLRDLLPGRYAFGLTGRGPKGHVLRAGRYGLRLLAWPTAGGAPSVRSVSFEIVRAKPR